MYAAVRHCGGRVRFGDLADGTGLVEAFEAAGQDVHFLLDCGFEAEDSLAGEHVVERDSSDFVQSWVGGCKDGSRVAKSACRPLLIVNFTILTMLCLGLTSYLLLLLCLT